jgi:hypothetical protein
VARPGQQHPGLAEQVEGDVGQRGFLFQLGRTGGPLLQAVAVDQGIIAEHEAVGGQRRAIDPGGHGGVHALQRIGEAGAERPAVVAGLLGQGLVGAVLVIVTHTGPHMCGTSSGIS